MSVVDGARGRSLGDTTPARLLLGVPLALTAATASLWPLWTRNPELAVAPTVVCIAFCAASLFLRDESGHYGTTSSLILLCGLLWPTNYAYEWGNEFGVRVSMIGSSVFWWAVAWAFFRYPRRRMDTVERTFIVLLGAALCGPEMYLLYRGQHYGDAWLIKPLAIAIALTAFVLTVRRFMRCRALGRRAIAPIVFAGLPLWVSGGLSWYMFVEKGIYTSLANHRAIQTLLIAQSVVLLAAPLAFAVTLAHRRRVHAAVAERLAVLPSNASIAEVGAALRRALGDDRIDILYWAPDAGSYVNHAGEPVGRPVASAVEQGVPIAGYDGEPLALLVVSNELAAEVRPLAASTTASRPPLLTRWLDASRRAEQDREHALHRNIEAALWVERLRLGRDLHDGVQQRLTTLGFLLSRAQQETASTQAIDTLQDVRRELSSVLVDLRNLAHGIAPVALADKGLRSAVTSLAERQTIPVDVDVPHGRLPREIEFLAYNVVAEALTNAAKHAGATVVVIRGVRRDDVLDLAVSDDGSGGVDLEAGTGLAGIRARVLSLGGVFRITSAATGTRLEVSLPCA